MTIRPSEGLLEQIGQRALDDDYYEVRAAPASSTDRLLTAVALAVFGLMITVAAVQTQLDRPSTDRERTALAVDVKGAQAEVKRRHARAAELNTEVAQLAAAARRTDPQMRELLVRSAGVDVSGEGITVVLKPAASDGGAGDVTFRDLRVVVNGLWALGAEAIAINGSRMATQGYIRTAGGGITVNYESIAPPYRVQAIGDSRDLRDRLEQSSLGKQWQTRAVDTGLEFDVETEDNLSLPAVSNERLSLEVAQQATPEREEQQ